MSKAIPTIQKYMTTSPHSIGADQNLVTAQKMMSNYKIRHLPVLNGGKIVGIISDRDVKFLESMKDVDPEKVKMEDIYAEQVFTVTPFSKLSEVCDVMAENKYGCAVVTDNEKLVGIFTWIDALRAMSELLNTRLAK